MSAEQKTAKTDALAASLQLESLLDEYRDEVSCKTYNGWSKRRDPVFIRKDIDALIESLRGAATPVRYSKEQELEMFLDAWVEQVSEEGRACAKALSRAAMKDEQESPLLTAAWKAWQRLGKALGSTVL